jgi:hypothetical protein
MDEFEDIFDSWADAMAWLKRLAAWLFGGIAAIVVLWLATDSLFMAALATAGFGAAIWVLRWLARRATKDAG